MFMKRIKNLIPIIIGFILLGAFNLQAQKHGGHGHGHKGAKVKVKAGPGHHHKVVVKRSVYRPAKIVVYHPHWGPKRAIHRRWVYFPKHNIYWDNWRNHYVYWNGTVWFSQPTPPPVIVNINLDNEKQHELKEDDDDTDDVYKSNDSHKTEYKPE
jgi:hypothetical protein